MSQERYKIGFTYGMLVGISALLLLYTKTSFPFYDKTITLDTIVIVAVALIAIAFSGISGFRNGRVVISRRGDGFIYGFALVFEAISWGIKLATGHLSLFFVNS